ncbi:MAG: hypothetical protein JJT77_04060 [Crocinitomicaceae bacterium]|nr:hypothetical protein [Crocinitomicaceae bacterium]
MFKLLYFAIFCIVVFSGCENYSSNWDLDNQEKIGRNLAQQQLDAYNNRDIDAFMNCYSVKIYSFPNDLIMSGWIDMKNRYQQMFAETPDLHCLLLNRMVQGNTVIDQELVTRKKGEPASNAIAIYKVTEHCIEEVYFIRK